MCLAITYEKIKFGVLVMTFIRPLTCFIFIFWSLGSSVLSQSTGDRGEPWPIHVIDVGLSGGDGVSLADVDGDQDLAVGWEQGGAIRLYLNPGAVPGVLNIWPQIDVGETPNVEDAMIADLDGDGRADVVSCSEGDYQRISAHFAPTKGDYTDSSSWETVEFSQSMTGKRRWMFSIALDVNEDGHLDLVVGGKDDDAKVA